MTAATDTAAWRALATHARAIADLSIAQLFEREPHRSTACCVAAADLVMDFSRQRLDLRALDLLAEVADAVRLRERIAAMFSGAVVNPTEHRSVLHTALRRPPGDRVEVDGVDVMPAVIEERARMLRFATAVRGGTVAGSTRKPFSLVVNIGIGGSDLGPAMAVQALRNWTRGGPRCEFVSNVDGCRLADLLEEADPATTLFVVCSKTFTTLETLSNARTARRWIAAALGEQAVPAHFAAVSVNRAAMDAFGVHPDHRFGLWDWVGGRYSIWSAVGLTLAIAIGEGPFVEFLAGGHAMDEHFATAPWLRNLPALMGLIGSWNVDLLALPTVAVLPYDDRLARFPAYLQQLEMESNGKSVRMNGDPVGLATGPVIWGEPGSNAQHSFFQLLHQGTPCAALDFLLPARSSCGRPDLQDLVIANCLAQAEAFAYGQAASEVRADAALVPHKVHPGSRPSTLLLFGQLTPRVLGQLIALYEHKVFTQSVLWDINAFDQWGVELGKKLCERILPVLGGEAPAASVSLRATLDHLKPWRAS